MSTSIDKPQQHPSSYRDPSGYIFTYEGEIYRQVNKSFQKDFELFISSGLYELLVSEKLVIPHKEIDKNLTGNSSFFKTIQPERISVVSYPYEWSFSMLKDAALLTLELATKALQHGMVLKDASPYNVQFHKGKMIFIDSLSFEEYKEGEPWIAYRQFCENFLGPLALMHYVGLPMQQLFLAHPNGIPLQYIKDLLPFRSRLNVQLYLHIHLHANLSKPSTAEQKKTFLSKSKLIQLLNGLKSVVASQKFDRFENVWGKYYQEAETRPGYLDEKKEIITGWLASLKGIKSVIDVGGNDGEFSKLASQHADRVICADGEHYAIEQLYKEIKKTEQTKLIPLCIDFTNPSPALGVNNTERESFFERAKSDVVMGLAIIHHLAIGKNISFELIAKMFLQLGRYLIIEFVAMEDEKVKLLLKHKKNVYDWYCEEGFVSTFSAGYKILEKRTLTSSPRTLYLMERL